MDIILLCEWDYYVDQDRIQVAPDEQSSFNTVLLSCEYIYDDQGTHPRTKMMRIILNWNIDQVTMKLFSHQSNLVATIQTDNHSVRGNLVFLPFGRL